MQKVEGNRLSQDDAVVELHQQWVRDHTDELYAFAFRYCGRSDIAEDLVAETYTEAWKSIRKLRNAASGRAWLFQILRHRCSHWLRDSGRRPDTVASLEAVADRVAAPGPGVPETLARREALQRALDRLDDRFKAPFLMVFLQGLSCREAAEALDVPLGTVLSRIHRARGVLRGSLAEFGEDAGATGGKDEPGDPPLRVRLGGSA